MSEFHWSKRWPCLARESKWGIMLNMENARPGFKPSFTMFGNHTNIVPSTMTCNNCTSVLVKLAMIDPYCNQSIECPDAARIKLTLHRYGHTPLAYSKSVIIRLFLTRKNSNRLFLSKCANASNSLVVKRNSGHTSVKETHPKAFTGSGGRASTPKRAFPWRNQVDSGLPTSTEVRVPK